MPNPDRIRYTGRIVGTLVGFGAGLVVIMIMALIVALAGQNSGGSIAQRPQSYDAITYLGAGVAFVVLTVVYRRVRARYDRRADEIERGAAEDG